MATVRDAAAALEVTVDDELTAVCPECGDGRFTADLLIPGGLRLRCWDCGEEYSPAQLAQAARKAAGR